MCTLALFIDVFDEFPLLVAANRDERYDRPAEPPALIAGNPKILAGRDLRAGGTWLGMNEHGFLVGILNRRANGAFPAHINPRSRGLLCMDLLRLRNSEEALEFLIRHEDQYNPFTVVFVDPGGGGVAFNANGMISARTLHAGLHVFSSAAVLDTDSAKADRAYQRFLSWAREWKTQKSSGEWLGALRTLLGDHSTPSNDDTRDAICIHGAESGTVSSSIIHYSVLDRRFESYYCAGPPCENSFGAPLALDVT